MRIECDYCLAVYESEDSENEEQAQCPFCASRPHRSTLRQFQVAPVQTDVGASSTRNSIACPPASKPVGPYRAREETPAYVRIGEKTPAATALGRAEGKTDRSAPAPDPKRPALEPAELPGIEAPARSVAELHRPAYDWPLPQVPAPAPSEPAMTAARNMASGSDDVSEDGRDADLVNESASAPRVDDIPRSSKVPQISGAPTHDTTRPLVRSQRSPADVTPLRRRAAAWTPFVLGAAGAAFLVRGWFLSPTEPPESKDKAVQVAIAAHLAAFEQSVSVGDMEQAVLALDRASRASPRDPGVLLGRAKLLVEQADAAWLVRKATPTAPTDGANFEDFVRGAGEARASAEEALRATPQSDDARRVLVSALRIFGEADRARQIAAGLRDQSSVESVYALAALDLIASDVPPESTASRLRQSVWVNGLPGKGRATLVYALVRAGDIDAARAELEKLALLARPHPAAAALQALVDGARAGAKPVAASVSKRAKKPTAKLCPEDIKGASHDSHSVAREAAIARCRGDVAGARDLYQSILDAAPNDPEALTGMGDLERHEDNWDAARNFYAEALRSNPAFLPAAIGAADVEWEVGNLPVAQRKYREILEAFPNASHPPRVQERATPGARGSKASG